MIQPVKHIRLSKSIQDNQWMDGVEQSINSFVPLGPFANDAAAAAGGVAIQQFYYDSSGNIHIRLI